MKKILLIFSILGLFLISCGEEESMGFDCDSFKSLMLDKNSDDLKSLLDPELANFTLLDVDNDACLYDRNLKSFIDFINENCTELTTDGYSCAIDSSNNNEVHLIIESNGEMLERSILLNVPQNPPLIFVGIR